MKINWGIIGCGDVTEVKSGPAFNKVDGSKLHMVMRRNAEKAKDYAERHQVENWTSDADELIQHPEIDAVYIATPPGSHAEYAIKAMKAGKPVYVEKPMAATSAQCAEMIQVSQETGQPLFVAYYRRTLPGFLKVKEMVDSGTLGKILYVNIRLVRPANAAEKDPSLIWRLDPEVSGGGIFYDLASHQLDYLDYLFGPIVEVNGVAANRGGIYKVEDTVSASFRFENGVVGNGLWSFVSPDVAKEDVLEIVGTAGKISIPCFDVSPIVLSTKDGETLIPYQNPENIQFNLIKQVVENLQGKAECVSTGESAARTNMVMEKIVASFYKKKESPILRLGDSDSVL